MATESLDTQKSESGLLKNQMNILKQRLSFVQGESKDFNIVQRAVAQYGIDEVRAATTLIEDQTKREIINNLLANIPSS